MPELTVHTANEELRIPFAGAPFLHALIDHIPDAPGRPCGGGGKCGGCAVAAAGSFSVSPDETGRVLACQAKVTGDAEIWLPRRSALSQIETRSFTAGYGFNPMEGEYAAAVDLGTTTIALKLLRLSDGETLCTVSCENPQRMIAADVIGRIEGALNGRLAPLTALVRDCVDSLERQAFALAGLPGRRADVRTVAGNTTMLYLFTGRNPVSLSAAPFEADCLFGMREGRDVLPACAGAFVGADITCAILSSGMMKTGRTAMLIDIGTNGEIALLHDGVLRCCATAAGPAFEGGGVSCGTGSIPGAIDSAKAEDDALSFTTISGEPPCGVCGSGLIDLTAALLNMEIIDETGAMDEDYIISENVSLTRQDVRQIQLAKGAIAAGMQVLLSQAGIGCEDVNTLYIAGGFGSHLNLASAARIGLIPAELVKKAKVLGNASLAGAQQLLLDRDSLSEADDIAARAQCLNLAAIPAFTNAFMECMLFEEPEED